MLQSNRTQRIVRAKALIHSGWVLAATALLFAACTAGWTQGITGSISGTVTDSSGAVIPGAKVTIVQTETNATHIAMTSGVGTYHVTLLPPGHYNIKAEKSGFKVSEQRGITLAIDQTVESDLQLTVGSENQSVVVTSAGPLIQTETSSVGDVIDRQEIQNIPINGRSSLYGLVALAPGVQFIGAQDTLPLNGMIFAIGTGNRSAYGGVGSTLDGTTNMEVALQRTEPETPSIDALQEFKVMTTGAPAEFNQPAQIIVASASGTNQYHGELFEFNRSKGTSAETYFDSGAPRPYYERNEFGGNFAGPVRFPGYNGRNRSFFFVAWEDFRLNQSSNLNTQQPTPDERAGYFPTVVNNPATKLPYPIVATGQYAGEYQITSPLNAVDTQLLNLLYPLPTTSGTGVNTYQLVPFVSKAARFSLRFDQKLSNRDQLRFTYVNSLYGPNATTGNDTLQGGFSGEGEHNTNFILGWTHTFSPTLLLDTDASYFHLPIYRTPQNNQTKWESIIPGLSPQLIEGAPTISITNITKVGESGSEDLEQVMQANTSLTKVFSRHTIKVGFGYLFDNYWADSAVSPLSGQYTFNGQYSGNALADFLLGLPNTTAAANPANAISRNISNQWDGYVEDDWKALRNLSINVGVRYDLQWFEPGPYGQSSLFVPSLGKVVVFGNAYPAGAISSYVNTLTTDGRITLSSNAGISNNPFSFLGRPDKNLAPRFGFAYQIVPNTVLRGAFGIYFNLLPSSKLGDMFGTLPFVASETFTNSKTYSSAFTMNAPFSATGSFSANPSVNAEHNLETPYTEEYNLALEHQFRGGLDVRLGYVGQHNLKQNNEGGNIGGGSVQPNINLADPPIIGSTAQSTALYQPLATISEYMDPLFHSTMNSLQIGVHKRYGHGFAVGAEYQWTRVLGTESVEDPSGQHPNDSYGPINGITPQVLEVSYSYMLPFGHGQLLFANANELVDKVVKGWQLSGISSFQTGQPFSVTYTAPGTPVGQVSGRANVVPGVPLYPAHKTLSEWFNPAAFTAPPCYNVNGPFSCTSWTSSMPTSYATYGTSGYDMLRGPGYQDWDMSLQKNTSWHDHYNVELRADSFNVFNHPDFQPPNAAISNTTTVGTITATTTTPSYQARTVEFAIKFSF